MRHKDAVGIPDKLFGRQPAHPLDEAAFDLSDVDRRIDRRAGIVQQVGAGELPLAGQRVDDDFGHRGTVGEVIERRAGHRLAIPRQLRRRIEPIGPQLNARLVRHRGHVAEREALAVDAHVIAGKTHVAGAAAKTRPQHRRDSFADLPRRVLRGHAIQIESGRCGGRRCVRYFGGVGRGRANLVEAQSQLRRDHLADLGVQPLPHFGPAMIHERRAVGVHMHERAGLVEVDDVERDAELDRRERDAFLQDPAAGIECTDRLAARAIVAGAF